MIFYTPKPDFINLIGTAKDDDATHFKTMRVKVGDTIKSSDLEGNLLSIEITAINKNFTSVEYRILKVLKSSNPNEQAVTKNTIYQAVTDKVYLEKLFEIAPLASITNINLFFSDRSIKQNIQLQRLNKILIRACEQSENLVLPKVKVFESKKELLDEIKISKPVVLACYLNKEKDLKKVTNKSCLVGPEGGWSQKELEEFADLNLDFVSLGQVIFPAWLAGFGYFCGI